LAKAHAMMMGSLLELDILDLDDDVADALVKQARAQRLPNITLTLNATQNRQAIVSADNTAYQQGTSTFPSLTASLRITQPIFDQGKWRAMDVAEAERALVQAQAIAARNDLTGALVDAYLKVATAQIRLQQARALVVARNQLESLVALEVDAGRTDDDALSRVRADTFEAMAAQSDAEIELSDALFDLYRFTIRDVDGVVVPRGVPVIKAGSFSRTFNGRQVKVVAPAVQVALAEAFVAKRELEQVRGTLSPTANLDLELSQERTEGSLFGGGSEVQSTELGVTVTVPIYAGGSGKARVREYELRLKQAELRARQVADRVARRHGALMSALKTSAKRDAQVAKRLSTSVRTLERVRARRDAGRATEDEVLEARLRVASQRWDVQIARLRTLRLQAEIMALFGAIDIASLSKQLGAKPG